MTLLPLLHQFPQFPLFLCLSVSLSLCLSVTLLSLEPMQPDVGNRRQFDVFGASLVLPAVLLAAGVIGRRCDDVALVTAYVDSSRNPDLVGNSAAGMPEEQMQAAAAGLARDRCGQVAESLLQFLQG